MYQSYLNEQAISHKHAELRQRGEEIRHRADHSHAAGGADTGDSSTMNIAAPAQGAKRFFTGVLATLRLTPSRAAKNP